MAISLESLFNLRTTARVTEDAGASQTSGNQNTASTAGKTNAVLPNMAPGQTVQGTIVSLDGEEIQLLLGEGQTIRAQVDESMNLQVGQKLLFTVMGNSSSQVRLSPLFFNMEQGLNAQKALEDAGLPDTKENMTMVNAMMKEGMPIDRESLLHMSRTLAAYPEEPVMNLVQMTRIGMPLTPENLEQFAHYKNLEHKLVEGMNTVMDDLSATYTEIADTVGADRAGEFYRALLDTFLPEEGNGALEMRGQGLPTEGIAENGGLSGEIVNGEGTESLQEPVNEKNGENTVGQADSMPKGAETDRKTLQPQSPQLQEVLSKEEQNQLNQLLEKTGENDGTATVQDTLQLIRQMAQKGNLSSQRLHELYSNPAFSKLLNAQIDSQWLLKPQDAEDGKNVTQLYERLRSQTQKLEAALTPFVKEDSAVMKSVTNLKENVEFMNQLNQMFTYVQLPLKMGKFNAHGDLYVYTNRKSLAKKDGQVSALLHLDMEHLGQMDVYVAMADQKVNTKFYLQDEETIDFLAAHIDKLDASLAKRGYQMHSELIQKEHPEKETAVIEEILKENRNVMSTGVAAYSFDMKA